MTRVDETSNPFEEAARYKKVAALVAVLAPVLDNAGVGPEILDQECWDLATEKAKLKRPPSIITKRLVIQALGGDPAVAALPVGSPPEKKEAAQASSLKADERVRPPVSPPLQPSEEGRVQSPLSPDPLPAPSLFDTDQARRFTQAAIQRASDVADETWKLRALQAVRTVAERQTHFIVDECWDFVEEPREPRAMGAVIQKAHREGWIASTTEYRPSARVTAHSNPRRVWRSLICVAVSA